MTNLSYTLLRRNWIRLIFFRLLDFFEDPAEPFHSLDVLMDQRRHLAVGQRPYPNGKETQQRWDM